MPVSATQIGAIGENLIANWLMSGSSGRLSPYQPVADDGGVDLLVYDRQEQRTMLLQVKTRTQTEAMTEADRKTIRFNLRTATFQVRSDFYITGLLLASDLHTPQAFWLIPSSAIAEKALRAKKDDEGNPDRLVGGLQRLP